MLDRSSSTRGPTHTSPPQRVPPAVEASHGLDPCHVPGEDAPIWLAIGFAVIGTLIAAASASAWQAGPLDASQTAVFAPLPVEPPPSGPSQRSEPAAVQEIPIQSTPQPTPEPAKPMPGIADTEVPAIAPAPVVAAPSMAVPPVPDRKAAASGCFHPLSIPFGRDSTRPALNDMRKLLASLQRWLSQHRDAVVLIEGHSDASGTEFRNVLLSYSRAKAIAALLRNEGIPAQQMIVRAAGSGEAIGGTRVLASDRNAVLRIVGVGDCDNLETVTKGP